MTVIIGLTGSANSGKGIVSAHLVERHGFVATRFAEPIKRMLAAGLGLTREQLDGREKQDPIERFGGLAPRQLMQTLGCSWGRNMIGPEVWVRAWCDMVPDAPRIVVDDLRFPNEAAELRRRDATIWRVIRPGVPVLPHVSERVMQTIEVDRSIMNLSTISALKGAVDEAVEDYLAAKHEGETE